MPAVLGRGFVTATAAVALAFGITGASQATPDGNFPNFTGSWALDTNDVGGLFNWTMTDNGDETFDFSASESNEFATIDINGTMKEDPFVIANLVVTNNSAFVETFTLTVNLPINPTLPNGVVMGGSVTGTLTSLTNDGATLAAPDQGSIFTALIDGNPVATLLDSPFSQSVGAFQSGVIGPASFGDPIPSMPGPPVLDSIGITLSFTLTPGDSASFTSIFVVEVPGPGALAVFGFAGLFARRRRR